MCQPYIFDVGWRISCSAEESSLAEGETFVLCPSIGWFKTYEEAPRLDYIVYTVKLPASGKLECSFHSSRSSLSNDHGSRRAYTVNIRVVRQRVSDKCTVGRRTGRPPQRTENVNVPITEQSSYICFLPPNTNPTHPTSTQFPRHKPDDSDSSASSAYRPAARRRPVKSGEGWCGRLLNSG